MSSLSVLKPWRGGQLTISCAAGCSSRTGTCRLVFRIHVRLIPHKIRIQKTPEIGSGSRLFLKFFLPVPVLPGININLFYNYKIFPSKEVSALDPDSEDFWIRIRFLIRNTAVGHPGPRGEGGEVLPVHGAWPQQRGHAPRTPRTLHLHQVAPGSC